MQTGRTGHLGPRVTLGRQGNRAWAGGAVAALVMLAAARPAAADGRMPTAPKHTVPASEQAIADGLAYLARTQGRDGAWRNRGYGRYPVAMTSLAGLAFLMNGNTTTQGPYAPVVDRAARFLMNSSGPGGLIARGDEEEGRPMHGHGFALLFLGELYGMTEDADRQRAMHEVLTRGIELTARSQSRLGGWLYTPDSG
ncbi:MAG: hypothetical protein IID40_08905, partial [Planctomycetes bacterium]|nr:hypothetical protein [Planctomycetota bacterium]